MAKKMAVPSPALLEKQRKVVMDEVQRLDPTFHHRVEEGEPRGLTPTTVEALGKEAASRCLMGSPAGDTQAHMARPSEKTYFSLVGRIKCPGGGERILDLFSQVFSKVCFVLLPAEQWPLHL